MQTITAIGLDIAKSVFQVHGVDAAGQVVIRRQLKRRYVLAFPALIDPRAPIGLRVRDTGALRFLRSLGLRLRRCSHERDEGVTNGALHGVLGRTVEGDAVNHSADDDAPAQRFHIQLSRVRPPPAARR